MKRNLWIVSTTVLSLTCVQLSMGAGMCAASGDAAATDAPAAIVGSVVETMNASRYTYVQIDTGKEKIWAAAPTMAIKTGECVSIDAAMPNKNFYSPTLKRTFEELFFVEKITKWSVTELALETPFLGKNTQSFLKLGYLRGTLYLLSHQHTLKFQYKD